MHSFNLHIYFGGFIRYMSLVNSCKSYGNQADGFCAANAWTDISAKLKIKLTLARYWCICNSLHNVLTYQCLNKTPVDLITNQESCQNAALPLNGMHLNIPSTEFWTPCRATSSSGTAWLGSADARSLAPWPIHSTFGYGDTTSPHQTFQGMVHNCNSHSRLWYLSFIAIPSFVCPKLACIEILISLHNNRHLFADGFVTVRPITMQFGWDKENVSSLKLRKFHLNPPNFNRKLTMMFKLDLKIIRLPHLEPRCRGYQNGLLQKVNLFCTENERLYACYAPTKNRTNWMRASCWFWCLEKIGHYFWRRV